MRQTCVLAVMEVKDSIHETEISRHDVLEWIFTAGLSG